MVVHCGVCDDPFRRVSRLNRHMKVYHASGESEPAPQPSPGDSDLFCIVNGVWVKNVDMLCLEPGRWLNDVIVDAYASLFPVDLSRDFVHN